MSEYRNNTWSYFENRGCVYFPCHSSNNKNGFNCMFCYCPLYLLNEKCGGNFTYTENGTKDCSNCLQPHETEDFISLIHKRIIENKGDANEA